ncbi:sulfotransferase family protein [Crocosphaera sp. Alani8]|uniref:sulfotransferase family protein n=1 Tax=Crocosphaera sp. Alani8 TaxID=3038952 RepID=UPI00313E69D4
MTLPQVINQFIKNPYHLPKNIIWRFPQEASTQKHIFVLGAPRSGTTLAKLILTSHPYLIGPGYETAFFTYRDIFSFRFKGIKPKRMDALRQKCHDIVEFFDVFTHEILNQYPEAKYYVEKTPQHILRLGFLTKYFPNSKFIHMVRDGRDGYCSAKYHKNVVQRSSVERYAKYWRKCLNSRIELGNRDNILDVQYETLASQPETTIKAMMSFIGENYHPQQLEPAKYSNNAITKIKTTVFAKLSSKINDSSIQRHKKELSQQEIETFNKIAGQQLRHFGYEVK